METKPNKGDRVVITKLDHDDPRILQIGMIGTIIEEQHEYVEAQYIDFGVECESLHNAGGLLKNDTAWALNLDQFELVKS